MLRIYANFSHSVYANDDGMYEVWLGDDEALIDDTFTTAEGAIAYADIHETRN